MAPSEAQVAVQRAGKLSFNGPAPRRSVHCIVYMLWQHAIGSYRVDTGGPLDEYRMNRTGARTSARHRKVLL